MSQLVEHYLQRELNPDNTWKSYPTKQAYAIYLRRWILPRWGACRLGTIKSTEVESGCGSFGWSNASISFAIAINLALFGLIGPFAASLMDRWGLRRVVILALSLLAISVGLTTLMRSECSSASCGAFVWVLGPA